MVIESQSNAPNGAICCTLIGCNTMFSNFFKMGGIWIVKSGLEIINKDKTAKM